MHFDKEYRRVSPRPLCKPIADFWSIWLASNTNTKSITNTSDWPIGNNFNSNDNMVRNSIPIYFDPFLPLAILLFTMRIFCLQLSHRWWIIITSVYTVRENTYIVDTLMSTLMWPKRGSVPIYHTIYIRFIVSHSHTDTRRPWHRSFIQVIYRIYHTSSVLIGLPKEEDV